MKSARCLIGSVLLFGVLLSGGCGSLSLLSDRHVHYHASPEADKKISDLEKRVETLEKDMQIRQNNPSVTSQK